MRSLILSIAVLVVAGSLGRADELADAVAAIPGTIEKTELVGNWTIDDKQGAYRLILGRGGADFADSRLFIQWLELSDGGAIVLRHNIEITELAELGVSVTNYFAEADDEGLSVFIDTLKNANDSTQTYELFIQGPDAYEFGPTTN